MAIVHFVNYKKGTQSRAAMRGVMLYVMQEKKTAWEGGPLVSGINCQPQSVYDDFLNTKLLYRKDGGVMFYHMAQSFPKGAEVDPRQAHEAARRLAEYFEGCEVLVCTHVDREHIHSHCVINSVNFETGKKLHMAKKQLQELMRRNDMICLEMGLPVFEPTTQQARGMSGAEYHTALKGQSWKLRLMNTIDACMKYAADKDAFVSLMASEGYQVRWEISRKYITYTTPDGLKCRDSKLHEEKYCKEAMEHEFRIRAEIVSARTQAAQHPADSASDADTTSRSVSLESGLGANDEIHGCTVVPCGSADGSVGERQQADVTASHTDAAGRSAEDGAASGTDDRTGWETEREVFLQVDRLASELQPAGSPQVDRSAFGDRRSGDGRVVWRGGDPRPVPLISAVAGLSAVGTLLDEDEDAEEKRRRMEAKIAAENFGAAIGFAAGAALAVKEKLHEQAVQEKQQQTMGGF